MLTALLITLRETIEATLIVATLLGILVHLKQKQLQKTVWLGTISAIICSLLLIAGGSLIGFSIHDWFEGTNEAIFEGVLMIISSVFVTWAVFFLHKTFAGYKTELLGKVRKTIATNSKKSLFTLAFTAVFREGLEIALFLSTIYLTQSPQSIFSGFSIGLLLGLIVCVLLFTFTVRVPVRYAFNISSVLLILTAAGLLARGIHEFQEVGMLQEIVPLTFSFLPEAGTFGADLTKSLFGLRQHMDMLGAMSYLVYIWLMSWLVFFRKSYQQSQ